MLVREVVGLRDVLVGRAISRADRGVRHSAAVEGSTSSVEDRPRSAGKGATTDVRGRADAAVHEASGAATDRQEVYHLHLRPVLVCDLDMFIFASIK